MTDFYTFEVIADNEPVTDLVRRIVQSQGEAGSVFYRATLVDDQHRPVANGQDPTGLWVEGWLERPDDQGPFDPPLILALGDRP